jgi:hypothetical protein
MESEEKKRVVVSGLEIPFWDLVWFMVKLALASVPAMFILAFFFWIFAALFGGMMQVFGPAPMP